MLRSAATSSAPATGAFPWRRPRRERAVLLFVALATLTQVHSVSTQDVSRLCLTRALTAGRLTISDCAGHTLDRARYSARIYSDKAPGLSIVALPAAELVGLPGEARSEFRHDLAVWAVRVLTTGVAFLLLTFALGRIAEGVAEGSGAAVAVAFALGTISGSLASTMFDQVLAAALCFGAFALAWRRQPGLAGALCGGAFVVEYQSAPIVVIVALYVASTGLRSLGRFLLGSTPGLLILGAYDWRAFGSPLHLSYRYVANGYARAQASGFFGISWPNRHAVDTVLVGDRGLLVTSPVLVAAAAGLVVLGRRYRREALVCAAVAATGLMVEFGYFLPYGGVSPGPRFLVPTLPFLALGLAPLLPRARALISAVIVASVIACTAVLVTWAAENDAGYRNTVWGEIARAATHAHSRLRSDLTLTLFARAGVSRAPSAVVVCVCAAVACALALVRPTSLRRQPVSSQPRSL